MNNGLGGNCRNWNLNLPPPPFSTPPPQFDFEFAHSGGPSPQGHRPVNNVWSAPDLFQPFYGGYCSGPQRGGFGSPPHQGHFDPARGRGRGNGGRGGGNFFGRGGGGWTDRGRGAQQYQRSPSNSHTHSVMNANQSKDECQAYNGQNMNASFNQNQGPGAGRNNFVWGNNRGGKNQRGKKERVDKRNLPENNRFHCEVCDRGFSTEGKHKEHTNQHQKNSNDVTECSGCSCTHVVSNYLCYPPLFLCDPNGWWIPQCPVKDCRYVAAPKLVENHYNAQHRTGVAKKIWNIKSSEEIKQWIEERKKKFPTKENVTKKMQEFAERRARGEVIRNKNFGKMRDSSGEPGWGRGGRGRGRGRGNGRGRGRGRDRWTGNPDSGQMEGESQKEEITSVPGTKRAAEMEDKTDTKKPRIEAVVIGDKLKDVADPLSLLIQGNDSSDSDDDDDDTAESGATVLLNAEVQSRGLASLISSYDTDSDDDKKPEEVGTKEEKMSCFSGKLPEVQLEKLSEHPEPERPTEKGSMTSRQNVRENRKRGQQAPFPQRARKPSLLEMILAKEIRHERNVILQCIYYIVKNKFFGVGQGPGN